VRRTQFRTIRKMSANQGLWNAISAIWKAIGWRKVQASSLLGLLPRAYATFLDELFR